MSWNSWTAAEASSPQLFGPGIDLAEQPVSEELIILYPVLGVIVCLAYLSRRWLLAAFRLQRRGRQQKCQSPRLRHGELKTSPSPTRDLEEGRPLIKPFNLRATRGPAGAQHLTHRSSLSSRDVVEHQSPRAPGITFHADLLSAPAGAFREKHFFAPGPEPPTLRRWAKATSLERARPRREAPQAESREPTGERLPRVDRAALTVDSEAPAQITPQLSPIISRGGTDAVGQAGLAAVGPGLVSPDTGMFDQPRLRREAEKQLRPFPGNGLCASPLRRTLALRSRPRSRHFIYDDKSGTDTDSDVDLGLDLSRSTSRATSRCNTDRSDDSGDDTSEDASIPAAFLSGMVQEQLLSSPREPDASDDTPLPGLPSRVGERRVCGEAKACVRLNMDAISGASLHWRRGSDTSHASTDSSGWSLGDHKRKASSSSSKSASFWEPPSTPMPLPRPNSFVVGQSSTRHDSADQRVDQSSRRRASFPITAQFSV
mmetsp:Transcript_8739/g.32947  ORF Transcript_8739/g.32947 Transcript_8739/m.32947 type:complete len:486 (-) Transcript_8739:390-1847(-)